MHTVLTIVRYPSRYIFCALCSMVIFRFPLWLNGKNSFWKLFGCGRNGSFDIYPDWKQWAILTVPTSHPDSYRNPIPIPIAIGTQSPIPNSHSSDDSYKTLKRELYGSFITTWWQWFRCETYTIIMEPLEERGSWDGKRPFGQVRQVEEHAGPIAVLTRASIRFTRVNRFWRHVKPVVQEMENAEGLIATLGIGEVPWFKQSTFSIWKDISAMKAFAYHMRQHRAAVTKTRSEKWYREEMFVRFRLIAHFGKINSGRFCI